MKINRSKCFFFICLFLNVLLPEIIQASSMPTMLVQEKNVKRKSWVLSSQSGFFVSYNSNESGMKIDEATLIVYFKNGKFIINGTKFDCDNIVITSQSGSITFKNGSYPHSLIINRNKKDITITHGHVDLSHTNTITADQDPHLNEKPIKTARQKSNDFTVRVLLDEKDTKAQSWKLYSSEGFIIMNPLNPSRKQKIQGPELTVNACKEGLIYINNKPLYTLQAYITPIGDSIRVNQNEYRGGLWILADGSSNKLINCLGIEDYVACVLSTESWPGWSLEINKVLAIACRTYVIAMVQNARTMKRPYHVMNTNKHQTYSGGNGIEIHRQAVEQTNGLFLTYESKPITAMFDCCCGGVVTKDMSGVDFKKAPYLARAYPCVYCKNQKIYSWKADYTIGDLEIMLKKELPGLRKLRDIKIVKKDKAGIVQKVEIKGIGRTFYLSGKKVYSLLNKKIKSFYFSVEKNGPRVTFKGKGYGHHLGLCQWGAKEMINQGHPYQEVLEYYYPGTQLMRLI